MSPRRAVNAAGSRTDLRGQALVEFTLIVPLFLLLVFGLVDAGRVVYLNSTLSQAAREGARLASVEARWVGSSDPACGQAGGPVCPATVAELESDVVVAVNRMIVPFGPLSSGAVGLSCDASTAPSGSWAGQSCTNRSTGGLVSVRVTATFNALTPVLGQLLGTLSMSGAATMVTN